MVIIHSESALPIAVTLCFWMSIGGVEPIERQIVAQLADPHSQMNASMLNTIGGHDECHCCARSTALPEFSQTPRFVCKTRHARY